VRPPSLEVFHCHCPFISAIFGMEAQGASDAVVCVCVHAYTGNGTDTYNIANAGDKRFGSY
jgi:hypothetical protein